jgi:signal transduction histidine kinase
MALILGLLSYLVLSLLLQYQEKKHLINQQATYLAHILRNDIISGNQISVYEQCRTLLSDTSIEKILISRDGQKYCDENKHSGSFFVITTTVPISYNPNSVAIDNQYMGGVTIGIRANSIAIYLLLTTLGLLIFVYFSLYFQRRFQNTIQNDVILPLNQLSEIMVHDSRNKNKINYAKDNTNIDDIKILFESYSAMTDSIEKAEKTIKSQVQTEAMYRVSSQLAHDIRSPLSALNMAMDSLTQIPTTEKKIITNAIQRINDIANDLLKKGDGDNSTKELQLSEVSISQAVEQIITEKQMQYKEFSNIVIESDINKDALAVAQINTSEFQRVISNLINNSVEAFKSNSGKIIISVKKNNDQVEISIKDNGQGIPSHLLEKLGQEGFSYGKNEKSQGGSGLGLFHAKQTILKFNGKLNISSTENNGTIILIQLPLIESAPVKINSTTDIVLLDNDQLVRMTWEMRAKKSNKKILCLTSYAELKTHLKSLDRNTIFYIDVHISDNEDGVQVTKDLFDQGFANLYLATGYEPEKFAHVTWIKGVVGKTPIV